jgi:hypothetical protein
MQHYWYIFIIYCVFFSKIVQNVCWQYSIQKTLRTRTLTSPATAPYITNPVIVVSYLNSVLSNTYISPLLTGNVFGFAIYFGGKGAKELLLVPLMFRFFQFYLIHIHKKYIKKILCSMVISLVSLAVAVW